MTDTIDSLRAELASLGKVANKLATAIVEHEREISQMQELVSNAEADRNDMLDRAEAAERERDEAREELAVHRGRMEPEANRAERYWEGRWRDADIDLTTARAENEKLRAALTQARKDILVLKNARWSEVEGSDTDWISYIDTALSTTPAQEGK